MREPTVKVGKAGGPRPAARGTRGVVAGKPRAGRSIRARVPGGKAMARLRYFLLQRGVEEPPKTPPVRGAAPATRGGVVRTGAAGASRYATAVAAARAAAPAAPAAQPAWRPLGPFSIPHGQTYGGGPHSRPSVSGRVSSIAVDPANADHLLLGAAGGGVWETKDGGRTWHPRTDHQPSLSIGAVAIDPGNPSVAYAGTGEADSGSPLGAGLLRSTDGGTTWALHAGAPFEGTGFYDILVDPRSGHHLLAGTTDGLFESADGGATWARRREAATWSLSMHSPAPGNPAADKEVFAACQDGVFRSRDGGTAWSAVALPGRPPEWQRIEVRHAPSDGNIVYVFGAGPPQIPDPEDPSSKMWKPYLWRRGALGGAFASISRPPDLQTGQAWYDWFAAVAPNNPNVLYLGAINTHKGIRSAAGTWRWQNITAKAAGDSIHPDQHAIAFSPTDPNVVYIGCDGGIFRSPDGGTTWRSLNKGLCITEFEFLAQHPQYEAFLLGGTQDNGSVRYQGGEAWYHIADGDGGDCGVNAASPATCYHSYYYLGLERSTQGGSWESWSWVGPLPPNSPERGNALFYPPVEVNGSVVAQAGTAVFISRNNGGTWQEVPLPAKATETNLATALAIPSPTRVYVASIKIDQDNRVTDSPIYRIDFAGNRWKAPVRLTAPRVGYASDLHVDPVNPSRLWVSYSTLAGSHVFRSEDGGTSWVDRSAGLPALPVNAIAVDPTNTDIVYVAADVGVYRSRDAGATWQAFSSGLPNALVKDLVFHEASRRLRAATQSRGVWEIPADEGAVPNIEIYLRDSVVDTGRVKTPPSGVPDPFTPGTQAFWWDSPDVKVDSPSFQRPSLGDVDFEVFQDDQRMFDPEADLDFAAGLLNESPQRNETVRIYVQVHNRGRQAATNVAVKVFFAKAAVTFPRLPAGFWDGFPDNVVPPASRWQPIGPHKVVPRVDPGRAEIVGFEWAVPHEAPDHLSLLAVIGADNDPFTGAQRTIRTLVTSSRKCALKSLAVVDPPPGVGPTIRALPLELSGSEARSFSLESDAGAAAMLRGVVLSKSLSSVARKARLRRVPLGPLDREELDRITTTDPTLKAQLDLSTAYRIPKGTCLARLPLGEDRSEPIVLLLHPKQKPMRGSIIQRDAGGEVVGGFTLLSRGA